MKYAQYIFNCLLFGVVASEARGDAKGLVAGVALDVKSREHIAGSGSHRSWSCLILRGSGSQQSGNGGTMGIALRLVLGQGFVKEKFSDEL